MIFNYFVGGNLVSIWIKIIKSLALVGFYYGILTTFCIDPPLMREFVQIYKIVSVFLLIYSI